MEVFVKVSSASFSDFFKLKLGSKDFCELVEDDYIFLTHIVEETFTSLVYNG